MLAGVKPVGTGALLLCHAGRIAGPVRDLTSRYNGNDDTTRIRGKFCTPQPGEWNQQGTKPVGPGHQLSEKHTQRRASTAPVESLIDGNNGATWQVSRNISVDGPSRATKPIGSGGMVWSLKVQGAAVACRRIASLRQVGGVTHDLV
jgi:hypothetical protein